MGDAGFNRRSVIPLIWVECSAAALMVDLPTRRSPAQHNFFGPPAMVEAQTHAVRVDLGLGEGLTLPDDKCSPPEATHAQSQLISQPCAL